jgi:zinc and cadmium transporter
VTLVLASFASVIAVSLVSLVGLLTLAMSETRLRRLATFFVSFAVGALLGDAFIHLIPQTFATAESYAGQLSRSLLMLGGILLFFVIEKLLLHRHGVLHSQYHADHAGQRPELVALNLIGDGIHNFVDGAMIGASYLADPALGVSTTIAVLLHEIPQELGDFAILVRSGLSVRKAVLYNLGSASLAIVGTGLALWAGSFGRERFTLTLLPITAGGFVYLAAADLIPELQHDRSWRALIVQTGLISLGIGIMGLLTLIE